MDRSSQWSEALELFDAMLERRQNGGRWAKGRPGVFGERFLFFLGGGDFS